MLALLYSYAVANWKKVSWSASKICLQDSELRLVWQGRSPSGTRKGIHTIQRLNLSP